MPYNNNWFENFNQDLPFNFLVRQRRKSRGEKDEDDEDWEPGEDLRIKKEIEELSKFKDTSGIGKIIYDELKERKLQPPKPLDPWKASRVPGADHEPRYTTRFQSPMFACEYKNLGLSHLWPAIITLIK